MMNNKIYSLILLGLLTLSCNNQNKLTEVEIPERESFIIPKKDFPDPATIKTKQGPFDMPKLSYQFNELPELFSAEDFYTHYAVVQLDNANKLNSTIHGTQFENLSIEDIVKQANNNDKQIKKLAGIYYNHYLFWQSMTPKSTEPSQIVATAINTNFGSLNDFKKLLKSKAHELDGAGYVWLVKKGETLAVIATDNNINPMMPEYQLGKPLLAIDLWEHSYYTKFENSISDYIDTYFKYINWQRVNDQYNQ
ncbi:superoxide dismutase [Myroides sp. BIT-d1]|uniref:Superoxide dismutase n=1 Tax=Myroides albus TaxID=2562892 RepID=A0A6I3LHL4_9FLAO|nr:superoxide dismutase [Myroides albus]MTG97998.1 superoxide dismutase [Myroides albus]